MVKPLSPGQFRLYHGTTAERAAVIDTEGIKPNDLGMVYGTDTEEGAETWARNRVEESDSDYDSPAIVEFHVPEEDTTQSRQAKWGEHIHWGHVKPEAIKSIWHLDD